MPDLRECPCCGKPGKLKMTRVPIQPLHGGKTEIVRGWVGCPECELYIQWAHDPRGAVEKWNRRAGPRLCITCTYSHWQGCTLHCRGQKLDPVTPPADSCEGWAPQA